VKTSAQTELQLQRRESGTGRHLVLLPGFPMDGRLFNGQLEAAAAGSLPARVSAVDYPGFGENPMPEPAPECFEVADLVEGLARLIREIADGPVVLGGAAFGCYVALELVARHPQLVDALVMTGARAAPESPKLAPRREEVARMAIERGSAFVADELATHPLGPDASPEVRRLVHRMAAEADARGIAAMVRGIARRPDPTEPIRDLALPVLLISGTADPFTSPEAAEQTAAMIPGARLVLLERVGHLAPLEAPNEVTAALTEFLQELA
jgi:pimeloyl-ACP methyl ester carboxylesterase